MRATGVFIGNRDKSRMVSFGVSCTSLNESFFRKANMTIHVGRSSLAQMRNGIIAYWALGNGLL
jgi:hypothetical protein